MTLTIPLAGKTINSDQLKAELIAAGQQVTGTPGCYVVDTNLVIVGTNLNQATCQTVLAAHVPVVARVIRSLLAIYNDLVALTPAQKTNVWADLTSGNPPKVSLDLGGNRGVIFLLWRRLVLETTLPAAVITDLKMQAATYYTQDNVTYLVHPAFDSTINVAGDQPIS